MAKTRKYTLKARAGSVEATRQSIVEAAIALHETVGPAQTTVSAIAQKAGVQRLTVYRHFPDEAALLRACGGAYRARHPLPEPAAWRAIARRPARVLAALTELYAHYRGSARMWATVLRDAETSDAVRKAAEPRFQLLREARDVLSEGAAGKLARAAAGHAVAFATWRSLADEGLSDDEAARLMTEWVLAAG